MTLPLVMGVDGSDASLTAVDWAVDEAAQSGLPLRLVHASRWDRTAGADTRDRLLRHGADIVVHDLGELLDEGVRR